MPGKRASEGGVSLPTNHSSDGSPESGSGIFKRMSMDEGDTCVPQNLKDIFKISNRNRKKNKEKKKEKMKRMKSDSGTSNSFSSAIGGPGSIHDILQE